MESKIAAAIEAVKLAAAESAAIIVGAYRELDKANAAHGSTTSFAVTSLVTAISVAGIPRTEAGVKMVKAAVKAAFEAQYEGEDPLTEDKWLLGDCIAMGLIAEASVSQYRNRAVKLWFHSAKNPKLKEAIKAGIIPNAVLDPLPTPFARGGGRPKAAAKTASKVVSTSREDLDKAIADAIRIAKALGLGGFAASIEDLAKASLSE